MIHTNLSTRPFYNERAVQLVLAAVAVVAVAATAFNVTRIVQLSRRDTQLTTQASRDEARVADLRAMAARLRASVDPRAIELASADVRQANDLIERRTFSWTELFNRFEMTLPDDVRIADVRPKIDPKQGIVLTVIVIAKSIDDVNQFIDKLEATGAFAALEKHDEHVDEQNQWEAALQAVYTPGARPTAAGGGTRR